MISLTHSSMTSTSAPTPPFKVLLVQSITMLLWMRHRSLSTTSNAWSTKCLTNTCALPLRSHCVSPQFLDFCETNILQSPLSTMRTWPLTVLAPMSQFRFLMVLVVARSMKRHNKTKLWLPARDVPKTALLKPVLPFHSRPVLSYP